MRNIVAPNRRADVVHQHGFDLFSSMRALKQAAAQHSGDTIRNMPCSATARTSSGVRSQKAITSSREIMDPSRPVDSEASPLITDQLLLLMQSCCTFCGRSNRQLKRAVFGGAAG